MLRRKPTRLSHRLWIFCAKQCAKRHSWSFKTVIFTLAVWETDHRGERLFVPFLPAFLNVYFSICNNVETFILYESNGSNEFEPEENKESIMYPFIIVSCVFSLVHLQDQKWHICLTCWNSWMWGEQVTCWLQHAFAHF